MFVLTIFILYMVYFRQPTALGLFLFKMCSKYLRLYSIWKYTPDGLYKIPLCEVIISSQFLHSLNQQLTWDYSFYSFKFKKKLVIIRFWLNERLTNSNLTWNSTVVSTQLELSWMLDAGKTLRNHHEAIISLN